MRAAKPASSRSESRAPSPIGLTLVGVSASAKATTSRTATEISKTILAGVTRPADPQRLCPAGEVPGLHEHQLGKPGPAHRDGNASGPCSASNLLLHMVELGGARQSRSNCSISPSRVAP